MTTLDKINGEALSVPGLTFRAMRDARFSDEFSLICEDERGAVELWCLLPDGGMGGVEVHSRTRPKWGEQEPIATDCEITGGVCWTDGSSLAYEQTFLPLIRQGRSEDVLRQLAAWHRSSFGEVA